MNLTDFLQSGTLKSAAIGSLGAVFVWGLNTAFKFNHQIDVLDQHTVQIAEIKKEQADGQEVTDRGIHELQVSVARVESKVDVVNQKIEDDRHDGRKARQ